MKLYFCQDGLAGSSSRKKKNQMYNLLCFASEPKGFNVPACGKIMLYLLSDIRNGENGTTWKMRFFKVGPMIGY